MRVDTLDGVSVKSVAKTVEAPDHYQQHIKLMSAVRAQAATSSATSEYLPLVFDIRGGQYEQARSAADELLQSITSSPLQIMQYEQARRGPGTGAQVHLGQPFGFTERQKQCTMAQHYQDCCTSDMPLYMNNTNLHALDEASPSTNSARALYKLLLSLHGVNIYTIREMHEKGGFLANGHNTACDALLGSPGSYTPPHIDSPWFGNVLLFNLTGKKLVWITNNPGDLSAFEKMDVQRLRDLRDAHGGQLVLLEANQGVLIPRRCYHAAVNLADPNGTRATVSINVTLVEGDDLYASLTSALEEQEAGSVRNIGFGAGVLPVILENVHFKYVLHHEPEYAVIGPNNPLMQWADLLLKMDKWGTQLFPRYSSCREAVRNLRKSLYNAHESKTWEGHMERSAYGNKRPRLLAAL